MVLLDQQSALRPNSGMRDFGPRPRLGELQRTPWVWLAFNFRSTILGRAATLRCDHCRGQLGVSVQRYWRMRFCSIACTSEYQQRLSRETQLKILTLETKTIESGAVQLVMFSSFGTASEERRSSERGQALDLN
jgi:hypothetical protein